METKLWIDGERQDALDGSTIDVLDPSTNEPLADVPLAKEADVNRAVSAAETCPRAAGLGTSYTR